MNMKKVLFITGNLKHYRLPILDLIALDDNIDLTVAHAGKEIANECNFKEVIVSENKLGPFTTHSKDFFDYCNSFDVVVAMFYLQKLSLMQLLFNSKRKFKLVYWGIGVKASQKSKFDSFSVLNYLRYYIAKKSDAMIFYTEYAANKYLSQGVDKNKIFVMNNTVMVKHTIFDDFKKDRLLFVGTLNKSKKIELLLTSYKRALEKNQSLASLDIVGGGYDYDFVKDWISKNNISDKIILHGAIYDELILEKMFKNSIACISPGQAGLSVLTSFGYGVPFITANDAITGGERLNIKDNFTGILFDTEEELENILIDTVLNKDKFLKMGMNAKEFYESERSPQIMAKGFIDAVKYVTNLKNQ